MVEPVPECPERDPVLLLAYGEIVEEVEPERVLAHLGDCGACRERFLDIVRVRDLYRRNPVRGLSPRDRGDLLAGATGGGSSPGRPPRASAGRPSAVGRPQRTGWGFIAAAAVIAVAFLTGRLSSGSDSRTSARLAEIEAELTKLRGERMHAAVEHPSDVVRLQGILALGREPANEVVPALIEVLAGDPSPNVRLAALDALAGTGALDASHADALLSRLIAEPSPVVRSALIDFVVARRIRGHRPVLRRLEQADEAASVRAKARQALERGT